MFIVGRSMRDVLSATGEVDNRSIMSIMIVWSCTFEKITSCAQIMDAWRRSLLCFLRRLILKLINWKSMEIHYLKMLGEMQGLLISRPLIIGHHMFKRDEEVVNENERAEEEVEAEIRILNPFRLQVHNRFLETNRRFNDRWQYIAPNRSQQELSEANLHLNHQLGRKRLLILENHQQ